MSTGIVGTIFSNSIFGLATLDALEGQGPAESSIVSPGVDSSLISRTLFRSYRSLFRSLGMSVHSVCMFIRLALLV